MVLERLRFHPVATTRAGRCLAKAFCRVLRQKSIIQPTTIPPCSTTSNERIYINPIGRCQRSVASLPQPCILTFIPRMPWVGRCQPTTPHLKSNLASQHVPKSSPLSRNATRKGSCTRLPAAATASRTRSTRVSRRNDRSNKLRTEPPHERSAIASRRSRRSLACEHEV